MRPSSPDDTPIEHTQDELIRAKLEELSTMNVNDLQDLYYAHHGRATRSRNRRWLVKRVSYSTQEIMTGKTLSDNARKRLKQLSKDVTVRTRLSDTFELPPERTKPQRERDKRLPPPGTVIRRTHKGQVYEILVLRDGFDYEARRYETLSTIAREVTGTSWNGFVWAGLGPKRPDEDEEVQA